MAISIQAKINAKMYLRDPLQTELGKKIIEESVVLIERLGFEDFTFKKLATEIQSTEASIYRYFENKHNLLVYLISWYWAWLEYVLEFRTNNIADPKEKIKIAIKVLTESYINDPYSFIDEALLHKIVVAESEKAYHTKHVDEQNKEGFFINYKNLCARFAQMILELNPSYAYPKSLSSTIIEAAHHQIYFANHLPRLTDVKITDNDSSSLEKFLLTMVMGALHDNENLR